MTALEIVELEEAVEIAPDLLRAGVPGCAAGDPETFIEQPAVLSCERGHTAVAARHREVIGLALER